MPGASERQAHASPAKRVAVMQPYFFPYAGYFRLFASVDEFIIFDCVQFPRRGRVHRSEIGRDDEGPRWLTLPLARQPRDVRICDLEFAEDARSTFDQRLAQLSWMASGTSPASDHIRAFLHAPFGAVIDFVEAGLRLVNQLLGLRASIIRSSALNLDEALRGQARVIAAAQAVGATHYINSPGGRNLYDFAAFEAAGMELMFLPPYTGRFMYLLPALMGEAASTIRADVFSCTTAQSSAVVCSDC